MATRDRLILPPPALAGCLYGALLRDTRGRGLTGPALYNHFPASPLVAVTWVFHGRLHMVEDGLVCADPLPAISISGPSPAPVTSWSPGAVLALTQSFKPEAWAALTGAAPSAPAGPTGTLDRLPPGPLRTALGAVSAPDDLPRLEAALVPLWQARRRGAGPGGAGHRLGDWVTSVLLRAATGGTGRSLRQAQRRLKALTGHSARDLALYAQVEALWQLSRDSDAPLARVALDGGFADQSHMGRAVRRVTGKSPAALIRAIAEDEAFWAYRLLGKGL
ncbi:MAG: AraC family transcriptional regulator [Maritimibacter sp.]|nr:AraC family transcriptional regulator [Maritimibacter sp.]